jgi:hypothetical protein
MLHIHGLFDCLVYGLSCGTVIDSHNESEKLATGVVSSCWNRMVGWLSPAKVPSIAERLSNKMVWATYQLHTAWVGIKPKRKKGEAMSNHHHQTGRQCSRGRGDHFANAAPRPALVARTMRR